MNLLTHKVKGAEDILPSDSSKWQYVEEVMRTQAQLRGFEEIRTPVFEHTELFHRGVGETTDVVQKEMYTFDTKGGESITLRPEGTAGVARAYLEHALYNGGFPVKVYYLMTCYRYEKAQAGRQREFHQFGMECYGSQDAAADAEMIGAANSVFKALDIKGVRLEINSIGCRKCRRTYQDALKSYFTDHKDELCDTCRARLERNPMRILDCKSEICQGIAKSAPKVLDYICGDCSEHFTKVQSYLDSTGIEYTVNPNIVRGLDYYTRTVFEFVTDCIGAQGTVCGGGRYDGLIEELGGQPTPALGFAMGIERLLLVMQTQMVLLPDPIKCDIYIASIGEDAAKKSLELTEKLREENVLAQCDIVGRSLRAQMKYADKIGARYSVVIGDDDMAKNLVVIKNMTSGEKRETTIDDFVQTFCDICLEDAASVRLEG